MRFAREITTREYQEELRRLVAATLGDERAAADAEQVEAAASALTRVAALDVPAEDEPFFIGPVHRG